VQDASEHVLDHKAFSLCTESHGSA
jgi:hypothetical protein